MRVRFLPSVSTIDWLVQGMTRADMHVLSSASFASVRGSAVLDDRGEIPSVLYPELIGTCGAL